jgi:hypothetical protein
MKSLPTSTSASAHASREELALFVLGALEAAPAARLERHVRGCAACAAALAAEAALENTLRDLVPRVRMPARGATVVPLPVAPPRAAVPAGRRTPWSSAFAAAAAVVLGVWALGADHLDPGGPPRLGAVSASLAGGLEGEGRLLCELERNDLLCSSPGAPGSPASTIPSGSDSVCRAPAGLSCTLQSRMP